MHSKCYLISGLQYKFRHKVTPQVAESESGGRTVRRWAVLFALLADVRLPYVFYKLFGVLDRPTIS